MRSFKMRGCGRVPQLCEVSILAPEHGHTADGYTIDLSRSGAKIFTELALAAGEAIEMTWGDRDPEVTLGGHVVYVRPNGEGRFAGVRFHQLLSPEAFRGLRDHIDAAARGLHRVRGES